MPFSVFNVLALYLPPLLANKRSQCFFNPISVFYEERSDRYPEHDLECSSGDVEYANGFWIILNGNVC